MKTSSIAIVLVLALALVAAVMAQAPADRPGKAMGQQLARELNLTPAQTTQLQQLHTGFLNDTKDTRTELQMRKDELQALVGSDTATAADIKAKLDQIDTLRTQIRNVGVDYMFQAKNILTPEQRAKFAQMVKSHPRFGMGYGLLGPMTDKGKDACPMMMGE